MVLSRIVTYARCFETLFPGVSCRLLTASSVFRVPFARDLCLWLGAIDASRPTAERALKAGMSLSVYPGGVREMFTIDPHSKQTVLVLKPRLGFLKLALRHNADLVPVMIFNEKHAYKYVMHCYCVCYCTDF